MASSSDYKVTFPQFLVAIQKYMAIERPFLRLVDVLCSVPEGYDSDEHEEIWDAQSPKEILDGARVANYDEVPYVVNWSTKQLVLMTGERLSLTQQAMKRLKKYKEGTMNGYLY